MLKERHILIIILCISAMFLARLFLDSGIFLTADEKRWQANVNGFTTELAHGNLGKLLQQPHPGITTQWFAAPGTWASSWQNKKIPLIASQIILIGIAGYLAYRLWGKRTGILLILLLAIDPLLTAHIRIYAMDSLLALFSLISITSLLLWQKENATRYLIFAAITAAAAALSKLPGILLIPTTLALLTYWNYKQPKKLVKTIAVWVTGCGIAAILILPSIIASPFNVYDSIRDFFASSNYTNEHPAPGSYYLRTLIFFSTPLHLLALASIPLLWKKITTRKKKHLIILMLFALALTLMMAAGAKKGDRYILPVFTSLDAISAIILASSYAAMAHKLKTNKTLYTALGTLLIILLAWQAIFVWQLHPYQLAYVNPITKPLFNNRRLGWGEGLDLAAQYLNTKKDAKQLNVASFFPNEFKTNFIGKTTDLHQWDNGGVDYAVLYRAQFERGENAWETDVLNQFKNKTPEKIIYLNEIEYAWIYRVNN